MHKYTTSVNGRPVAVECKAEDTNKLTEDDISQLKHIPGVWEAYHGAGKMCLKVCTVIGKKACVYNNFFGEFQNALLSIKQHLENLERDHVKNWEDLLEPVLVHDNVLPDPRDADPEPEDPAGQPKPPVELDLTNFESEKDLSQKVKIVTRLKCNSDKYLVLLEDVEGCIYALCTEQDHVVKKGTKLGGVGSGKMMSENLTLGTGVVPLELESDKTWVEVAQNATDETDDISAGKLRTGSLYMVAKELIKQTAGKPVSLASVGRLIPREAAGSNKHGFNFENPKGSAGYKPLDYVVRMDAKADKTKSAGNMFKCLANRKGVAGPVQWMFRFHFNAVTGKLVPAKPFLISAQDVSLTKDKPVKIAWPIRSVHV